MEPFEWLMLGAGIAIGSLLGSRGKGLMRSVAKGYLVVADTTRNVTANVREDFRDALEEARYEREEEELEREREQLERPAADDEDLTDLAAEVETPVVVARPIRKPSKPATSNAGTSRSNKKSAPAAPAAPTEVPEPAA